LEGDGGWPDGIRPVAFHPDATGKRRHKWVNGSPMMRSEEIRGATSLLMTIANRAWCSARNRAGSGARALPPRRVFDLDGYLAKGVI